MDVNKNDEMAWYIGNSWAPSTPVKPSQSRAQPIQAATLIDEPNEGDSLDLEEYPPGFPHKIQTNACNSSYNPSNNTKYVEESYHLETNCQGSEGDTDWSINTNTGAGLFSNLLALASSGQTTSTSEVQGKRRTLDDFHHSVSNSGTCERVRSIIASYPELDFLLGPSISCSAAYACEHLDSQSHGDHTSVVQTMYKDVVSQTIIPQFAPITPQKPLVIERRISEKEHLATDAQTGQEHNRQENIIAPTDHNVGELEQSVNLELSGNLNCATDLMLPQENHDQQNGETQVIEVDKAPQKKERRRKHRPKVVTEGKPKRTPRKTTPKSTSNIDPKTGKRKYVRKKGIEKPQSSPVEAVSNPTDPNTMESGPKKKTCRRSLNFDMKEQTVKETLAGQPLHTSESQAENPSLSSKSSEQLDKELEDAGKRASSHAFEFDLNTNPGLKDPVPSYNEEREGETATKNIMSQEKLGVAFEMENISIQATGHEMSTKMVRSDNKLARTQCDSYSNCSGLVEGNQVNALKTKYPVISGKEGSGSMNFSGVQCNNLQKYDKMFKSYFPYLHNKDASNFDQYCMLNTSPVAPAEKIGKLNHPLDVYSTNPLEQNCSNWISTTQTNACRIPATFGEIQKVLQDKQQEVCCILQSAKSAGPGHAYGDFTEDSGIATTMNYVGPSHFPKQGSNNEVDGNIIIYNHRQIVPKSLGGRRKILKDQTVSISVITKQLKRLNINKGSKKHARRNQKTSHETRIDEQSALVLYQRDGTIVPFSSPFNTPKRRHERPKVDLDSETTRVWMLLLENINNEGIDGTDEEKAKWWEEERRVFKGRADSFIARMHLVQGDRRFSKWKGSVVDSVVGVFLTQNVSDHLSSSAFMSVAARFPCNTDKRHYCNEGFEAIVDDAQTCLSGSEFTNKQNETNQGLDVHCSILHGIIEHKKNEEGNNNAHVSGTICNSTTANELEILSSNSWWSSNVSASHSVDNISATGIIAAEQYSVEGDKRWENKESALRCSANSSPTSAESSITQASERTEASCLGNNPKADATNRPNSFLQLLHDVQNGDCSPDSGNVSSGDHLQLMHDRSDVNYDKERLDISILDSLDGHLDHVHSTGVSEVDCTETFQGEFISFGEIKHANRNCDRGQITSLSELSIQNSTTGSDDSTSSFNANNQPRKCSLLEKDSRCWTGGQNTAERLTLSYNNNNQHCHRLPDLLGQQVESVHTLRNNNKELARTALSNQERAITMEASENNRKTSGEKLRKVKKLKEDEFDWDSLRKQSKESGAKRERTEDTMDSVDWEAVRSADVNEIADTIKERGMNNRLAARIKDFLNRLVEKHGSIDLEWLRDVPPDKAKEYLLSFKGLGLKSVECVRLLTLHHLAFPVDTNVGRIAVRLGWVPLQPLPESLQLHLLELYPVLESIQQYLWPRLCKLDQRTLYELHYQMITFGKVFCTKSKPNCNACPMRGECRHFASAFASARLALPGPEEKGRVDETQKAIAQIPSQLELLPPPSQAKEKSQEMQLKEVRSEATNCQPIIEEPASPEQTYTQVSERDIEDVIPEDSDEIPTIKLNMEAFTLNLQSYVQQNMELQVSEVSKALVALTPEAASVPVPKLKNISRLRTEHLVYEIPEGHPLLNGMDRLEPDDPSKYLLAIWSPGETATSIQPPDRTCNLHEFGGLCDDITCVSCSSRREAHSQIVRGTFLIPCRTAMRGSFPLNGTYFQVNEVFADHDSSLNPIDVPRNFLWNLPRRTVYFGTSVTAIFKGLSTEAIQHCFWRGYVCVRGFDRKTRSPRPLMARLHFPPSRLAKNKSETGDRRT